jgi:hypothetical protein
MPPLGLEPTISAGERSKTYALDRAATGTGNLIYYTHKNITFLTTTINAKLFDENMQISLTFSPESKISETSSFIHFYRKQYFAPV